MCNSKEYQVAFKLWSYDIKSVHLLSDIQFELVKKEFGGIDINKIEEELNHNWENWSTEMIQFIDARQHKSNNKHLTNDTGVKFDETTHFRCNKCNKVVDKKLALRSPGGVICFNCFHTNVKKKKPPINLLPTLDLTDVKNNCVHKELVSLAEIVAGKINRNGNTSVFVHSDKEGIQFETTNYRQYMEFNIKLNEPFCIYVETEHNVDYEANFSDIDEAIIYWNTRFDPF